VQSEKFVEEHQGKIDDISIYGQESNQTTWRLAKMNLAIRGIDSSQVKWNNEGSFLKDAHTDLKADYIIANPPFNVSDWSGEQLRGDARWQFGTPPPGNANFAWLQHFVFHLSPQGRAGVVLAKGALTSKTSGEGDIRKAMIEQGNLIDCIVNLPAKLFLNTQIPAALWFLRRGRGALHAPNDDKSTAKGACNAPLRNRSNEILFIDARNLGHLINRRTRELSHDDIRQIADTYHAWLGVGADCIRPDDSHDAHGAAHGAHAMRPYEDIPGFCASVPVTRVAELDYVLTPGRYVGLPDEEDDFNFAERFAALKAEFEAQLQEEAALNKAIAESLARVKL
jgi:type I restriction enzyme M protein